MNLVIIVLESELTCGVEAAETGESQAQEKIRERER